MDDTEIVLTYPITDSGVELDTVRIRRPKVRDRLAVERLTGTEAEKEVRFIANLCSVTPDAIGELDMADYVRVQKVVAGFFE